MRRLLVPLLLLASAAPHAAEAGSRVPPVASYRIEASYEAREHRIDGKETVTFVNRTDAPIGELALHLYLNGFRNDLSTWLREDALPGGRTRPKRTDESRYGFIDINRIALSDGTDLTPAVRFVSPDDRNPDDRTLAAIPLPRAVAPGETLVFDVDFVTRLPRAVARTGWKDDYVLAAQWFPKLAVAGSVAHQFHARTEFFADFGDYDVTLSLPHELKEKVGATGVLRESADLPGDRVRVRFVAEDVHDFAWTASPRFEVHRDTFSSHGLPSVELLLFLQPDHRRVRDRYFAAARAALASYGSWYLPYPYPSLTIVDPPHGSNTGGMEYPTLITGGASWLAPRGSHSPEGVTVHEVGHQVFHGILASNEVEEAHLDEGFNTYSTHRVLRKVFGDPFLTKRFFGLPVVFRSIRLPYPQAPSERALDWQVTSRSDATRVPSFRDLDLSAVRANAYSKTALALASCERTLGAETWARVLKTYATRFAFRHPTSADFLGVAREVAGPGATALLDEAWGTTETFDYAVTAATSTRVQTPAGYLGDPPKLQKGGPAKDVRYESIVVVQRLGGAVWPVDVELRFAGGKTERRTWSGRDGWIRYRITGPRLLSAVVDPDAKLLLDVDRTNNGRLVEPDRRAADRWGHRLRFWAQNVLESFALLGTALPGGGR